MFLMFGGVNMVKNVITLTTLCVITPTQGVTWSWLIKHYFSLCLPTPFTIYPDPTTPRLLYQLWRNIHLVHLTYGKSTPSCSIYVNTYLILINIFKIFLHSLSDPFTIWCAHKAFITGIFIQLGSRLKRQRTLWLNQLLKEIHALESQNKINPNYTSSQILCKLHSDLRLLLIE